MIILFKGIVESIEQNSGNQSGQVVLTVNWFQSKTLSKLIHLPGQWNLQPISKLNYDVYQVAQSLATKHEETT